MQEQEILSVMTKKLRINDLSKGFREQCEWTSVTWREKFSLQVYDALPANVLAKACDAKIVQPAQESANSELVEYLSSASDWSGIILSYRPITILYNPSISAARYESTVMHELAHILLNHPRSKLYLAPNGELKRTFDSLIEAEASYLGSCLQVPRRGLQWALQREMKKEKIADHFGTSVQMVQWRINATKFG